MLLLILILAEVDIVIQEKSYKRNMVGAFGFGNGKIILILLIEVITFHAESTTIHIR